MPDVHETNVIQCVIVDRPVHEDDRGFFQEVYRREDNLFPIAQSNVSVSHRNVLRGIHVSPYPKLVTCLAGQIFDVCVDLRSDSPTYLQVASTTLVGGSGLQFLIPAHCGHGFFSVVADSIVLYHQGGVWKPNKERIYDAFSPDLNIEWPKNSLGDYLRSDKDAEAPVYKV
jgi:dTDP-4-dehydrorhamnose 3,5-epimerase